MIHIDFDPAKLCSEQQDWWVAWRERADTATRAAIDAWEDSGGTVSPPWDREVWKDLKYWLLENVFHHKCAYCETPIVRFYGDAEHYRPKGGVAYRDVTTGELRTAQVASDGGELRDHPGYFWLAYNWRNLVPSCTLCNSGEGKQNQFPVRKHYVLWERCTPEQVQQLRDKDVAYARFEGSNQYYLGPLHLDEREGPELLHPYRDKPEEHLGFEAGGRVTWKSGTGERSVKTYGLDDHNLSVSRHLAQMDAKSIADAGYNFWLRWERCGEQEAWQRTSDGIRSKLEDLPYTAAGCDYVRNYCKPRGID